MTISNPAQPVVGAFQRGRQYIDGLANKYVVKPKTAKGIGGFVFDVELDTRVVQRADITDHWAEDNTFINDHIALKPASITLRGFVAELAYAKPQGLLGAINILQDRLGVAEAYLQKYTPQAIQEIEKGLSKAVSITNQIDQGLRRVQNIVGMFGKSSPAPTKQELAYQQLLTLMQTRQIFTVQTPFAYHPSMVVEQLSFTQPEGTRTKCDIEVVLKEFRTISVDTFQIAEDTFAGRAAGQRQVEANNGKTNGTPKDVSLLKSGIKAFQ